MASKCNLCQALLGNKDKRQITTVCGHTFHQECAQQHLIQAKRADCPTCQTDLALGTALTHSLKTSIDKDGREERRPSALVSQQNFR